MVTANSVAQARSAPPVFDEMLVLLASRYRRRILFDLYDGTPGDAPHDENGWYRAFATETGRAEQVVRAQLQHLHLPQLDEAELIEWDREWGTVGRGPRFEEVVPFLEMIDAHRSELPADWQ